MSSHLPVFLRSRLLCACALLAFSTLDTVPAQAQAVDQAAIQTAPEAGAAPATVHEESPQEFLARLTPGQKQQFDAAVAAYRTHHFSDALTIYKALLKELPDDTILAKFASEDALNGGNTTFAMATLKPLVAADPHDWHAASLLTRACAEAADAACRDAGIAHMLELKKQGAMPSAMQEYIVEHVNVAGNDLVIWASLEPLGQSKSYDFCQVSDAKGNITLQIALESNEKDQQSFAMQNQYQASQGVRAFSIHAYKQTAPDKSGTRYQTNMTYKSFVGQPTYAVTREWFLKVASGKPEVLRSSTAPLVH